MNGLRCGPGKVDSAMPGCNGEQELALDGCGILGWVRAWGLGCVEKDVAAVSRSGSCELFGSGEDVGSSGECSSADHATSQVGSARTAQVWDEMGAH